MPSRRSRQRRRRRQQAELARASASSVGASSPVNSSDSDFLIAYAVPDWFDGTLDEWLTLVQLNDRADPADLADDSPSSTAAVRSTGEPDPERPPDDCVPEAAAAGSTAPPATAAGNVQAFCVPGAQVPIAAARLCTLTANSRWYRLEALASPLGSPGADSPPPPLLPPPMPPSSPPPWPKRPPPVPVQAAPVDAPPTHEVTLRYGAAGGEILCIQDVSGCMDEFTLNIGAYDHLLTPARLRLFAYAEGWMPGRGKPPPPIPASHPPMYFLLQQSRRLSSFEDAKPFAILWQRDSERWLQRVVDRDA